MFLFVSAQRGVLFVYSLFLDNAAQVGLSGREMTAVNDWLSRHRGIGSSLCFVVKLCSPAWTPTEQLLKWKTAAVLYHLNRPVLRKNQSWELNLASGSICPPTLLYSCEAEYLIQTKGINNGSEHQRLLFYVRVLLFFVFCACNKTRNPSMTLPEQKTVEFWPFLPDRPCCFQVCSKQRDVEGQCEAVAVNIKRDEVALMKRSLRGMMNPLRCDI